MAVFVHIYIRLVNAHTEDLGVGEIQVTFKLLFKLQIMKDLSIKILTLLISEEWDIF